MDDLMRRTSRRKILEEVEKIRMHEVLNFSSHSFLFFCRASS